VRYRFGNIELDPAAYTLRRSGRELSLQPKVFDVLRYLIEHRTRVVSKEELLDAVWRGEHVNESAVPWSISHARSALGQRRGSKKPIETVHGRGYRFSASVFEVAEASAAPPAADARPGAASVAGTAQGRPFVGRSEVMQRLQARLAEAIQGHGRLCLLYGEAGLGKTRCGEELLAYAAAQGVSAFVGRSVEDAGEPNFWPWIQILREAVRQRSDMRELGGSLLTRLAALDPSDTTEAESEPERDERARRFWLLDEVTRLLLQAAHTTPMLLFMDDLQWADAGTLNLLVLLAPELANARILIVATQREETQRGPQHRLTRLARHGERIELTRLSPDDVGRYIAELSASSDPPPASLSLAVHRAAAGNPLFVQETVRALITEHGEAALASLAPSAVKFPEVARDVLRKPLEALPPAARSMLAAASVLGESFELPLLKTLCGMQLPELLDLIEAAARRELITSETPQRYRFTHALIRALLYDEIPTAERVALHRRAGEALEALHAPEPRHAEIAQHYYRSLPAGAYDHVVAATRRAALAAEAGLEHEAAVRFYGWALEAQALDPNVSPRDRAELLLYSGRAQRHAARERDTRHTLGRLFDLARQHGYGDLLVRGARVLRPTVAMSSIPDELVRTALEDALRIEKDGPDAQRILAMSQLACIPPYASDMQRSKQMSERALELARRLGQRGPLFEALRARLYSLSGPDDTDALLTIAEEILELDRERPTMMTIEGQGARVGALLYRGETAAADQALESLGQVARQMRLPEAIWYYDRQRAQSRFLQGDFAPIKDACDELTARSARLGLGYGAWFIETLRVRLFVEQMGFAAFSKIRGEQPAPDAPNLAPIIRARLVRGAAMLGQRAAAVAGLDVLAARGFDSIPKEIAYLNVLSCIALATVELSDRVRAEQVYGLLAPYEKFNTPDAMMLDDGSVARYLALLAASLGWRERARLHFEEALARNRAMGRRGQLARTCYEYAKLLLAQPQPEQASRARALADEACTLAETLGMPWLVESARELA
jgi:DNA-binding winged helix-turn-helix (wHTH) protein